MSVPDDPVLCWWKRAHALLRTWPAIAQFHASESETDLLELKFEAAPSTRVVIGRDGKIALDGPDHEVQWLIGMFFGFELAERHDGAIRWIS